MTSVARCQHDLIAAHCGVCSPPPAAPRDHVPYAQNEQDAIARFVYVNRRMILDPSQRHAWRRSTQFTALTNSIPRHSEDSIALQVIAVMDTVLGTGGHPDWINAPGWVRDAWGRVSS